MGAAVKPVRGGKVPRPFDTGRKREFASPVDKAKGNELDWAHVSPVFEAVRGGIDLSFVYFIGEEDNGPVKIGVAKCPVSRLRTMQTGNPRRLRIERLLIGDRLLEKLLHELWIAHSIPSPSRVRNLDTEFGSSVPGTEWFKPGVRESLFPVVETAAERQITYVDAGAGAALVAVLAIVVAAHNHHGVEVKIRERLRFLAPSGGKH